MFAFDFEINWSQLGALQWLRDAPDRLRTESNIEPNTLSRLHELEDQRLAYRDSVGKGQAVRWIWYITARGRLTLKEHKR